MKKIARYKGQNLIEFLLLSTIIIVVMLVFLNIRQGPLHQALNTTLNASIQHLETMTSNLTYNWQTL